MKYDGGTSITIVIGVSEETSPWPCLSAISAIYQVQSVGRLGHCGKSQAMEKRVSQVNHLEKVT